MQHKIDKATGKTCNISFPTINTKPFQLSSKTYKKFSIWLWSQIYPNPQYERHKTYTHVNYVSEVEHQPS